MAQRLDKDLRKPDAQSRIAIGKEHANELFSIEAQPNGDILLRPVVVIPRLQALSQATAAMASEGMRHIWDTPEEDEAWRDL